MRQAVFVAGAWLCLVALGAQAGPAAHSSQVIVRVRPSFSQAEAKAALDGPDMQLERWLSPRLGIALVHMNGISVSEGLAQLSAHPALVWAQADHFTQDRLLPDDSAFGQQWSLNQASDADVDAPEAWDQNTGGTDPLGRRIVVAVVDGGMDLAHPDLSANVWSSLGEIPGNSQDDDSNGFVDDVNGWNAYNNSGTLVYNGHGTHVSGIVGARGNNLNQVCGVNWDVDLMTVCGSSTATSVALAAYNYVLEQKTRWLESGGLQGANVVATNSSFGVNYGNCSSGEYPAWNDMYNAMGAVGILSAASTMNINANVDIQGDVPTSCSSDYLVTVTNTTSTDLRNTSSAYGLLTIDLGAPGTQILSTHLNSGTANLSGTSMSAPHVAGAVALLHAVASDSLARLVQADPALGALVIKQLLLDGVDPLPALAGITVSGGRLNLQHAAQAAASWPPQPELTLQIERTADQRVRLNWSAVPGALGYHVESRASMDAPWNRLATQVETSWTSAPHAGSATAQYRVIAELP